MHQTAPMEAGESFDVSNLLGHVKLPTPLTRSQQLFNNALLNQISTPGRPSSYQYNLRYEISESISGLGLLTDGTSSLSEITYTIPFTLSDAQTGKTLLQDQVSLKMSYTISTGNPYATIVGKEGIDAKAFVLLARSLVIKMAVALSIPKTPLS